MKKILIVDDSSVIRHLLRSIVNDEDDMIVAEVAHDGEEALDKLQASTFDLVVLDIEMPRLDGLETLKRIRRKDRRLPVIMFSTLTAHGAAATLDALALGASDYATKPEASSIGEAVTTIRSQLVPKIRALVGSNRQFSDARAARPRRQRRPTRRQGRFEVVVIGVSTGGPNALAEVVPALPERMPVPTLIVQHMPPVFTKLLAERLDQRSAVKVTEAESGVVPQPGEVWIAPGGRHLVVSGTRGSLVLETTEDPPENSCRPAADVLFRSAATVCGSGVLAVVLTGMGQDGMEGARAVQQAGGSVMAQDAESSIVWGMPGHVVEAGLADQVLPLSEVAETIVEQCGASGGVALAAGRSSRGGNGS